MSRYRRAKLAGGTFFFTVALADRSCDPLVREIDRFRQIYRAVENDCPFETIAICVLPDHVHAIWALPGDDADFALRWRLIKSNFSRGLLRSSARSPSQVRRRESGIWQRRYWEHAIRSDADLERHVDYVHFNPVKHGLVTRVRGWTHTSFHRYVRDGVLPHDWGGDFGAHSGAFGEPS
jgi:putative transposase